MPPIIPDYVPRHFAQGTTVKYTRSLSDFPPSSGWSYTLYLNGLTQKFNKAAAAQDPSTFLVELTPTDTGSLAPGPYRYAERLSNPGTDFVLTQAQVAGANGVYSYSSYTGPAPYLGMAVSVTGFVNGGNNVPGVISALTGDASGGTFTIANATAVNETHAGAAAGPAQVYDITGDELVINIEPSADTSPAGAFQTFEEKTLAAIEAVIAGRVTSDIEAYHIAGRAVTKIPLKELLSLRGLYRGVVWRQQHPGKLGKAWKIDFSVESEMTNLPPTWQDVTGLASDE